MRIIRRCLLALVAIWAIATGVIVAIQAAQPTPQKLMAYLADNPLEGLDGARREAIVDGTAGQLNALTFEQRQELRETGTIRTFFVKLTSEERHRFLAATLPEGFRQLVATLNKMELVDRKKLVQRTLRNLRKHSPEAATLVGDAEIQKIVSQGLSSFYESADAQVKLDFAPVIEELLRQL